MQSFDFDFPAGLTSYVSGPLLGRYFADYCDHFKLRESFRFQSRVEKVERKELEGKESWQVMWTSADGSHSEDFEAVCVASGHYEFPYCPEIPGEKEWLAASKERKIIHAVSYDDPDDFQGQSVLIVGGRSSAVDIARELKSRATSLYVLESGCSQVTLEGHCVRLPVGTSLHEDGKLRYDGEVIPGAAVETIILATGYTYRFPFLDEKALGLDFGPSRRYVAPLYQHVIHAEYDSICFMGIPLAVPTPLPLFEAQAYFAAAHLQRPWTTSAERHEWVSKALASAPRSQDLHFISGYAWDHMRNLVREAAMPESDFNRYDKRLKVVQAIYQDRVQRKPHMPWDEDSYRNCQYQVDYESGRWSVTLPDGSTEEREAKL